MKKLAVIATCLLTSIYTYGQGTINFDTYTPDALVLSADGNPATTAYQGQLFGGTDSGSLAAIGTPQAFYADDPAEGAGYILAGTVTVDGVLGGSAYFVQLRAWNIASPGSEYGESNVIPLTLGGAGEPPTLPADLVGLQGFTMVPEPSTIALGLLGAAALLIRRRK